MVCKTCRKLSFDLKEKNSKDLVAELRSKNPYTNPDKLSEGLKEMGYDKALYELEKLLKEIK